MPANTTYVVVSLRRHPRAKTYVQAFKRSNLTEKTANKMGKVHDIWAESVPVYQKSSAWAEFRLTDGFYLIAQPSATESYVKALEDGSTEVLPKSSIRTIKVEKGTVHESSDAAIREAFKMPAKAVKVKASAVAVEPTAGAISL